MSRWLLRVGPYGSVGQPGDRIVALSLKRRTSPENSGSDNSAKFKPHPKLGEGTLSQERLLKMELKSGRGTHRVSEHLLEVFHGLP